MIRAICLNDKDKPILNNPNLWVEAGKAYTIINILKIPKSQTLGVELSEIDMSENDPYLFFKLDRFMLNCTLEEFIEFLKTCKDLSELDIQKLLECAKPVEPESIGIY